MSLTYCTCAYPDADFSRMPIRCKRCGRVLLPSLLYAEQENRDLKQTTLALLLLCTALAIALVYLAYQIP